MLTMTELLINIPAQNLKRTNASMSLKSSKDACSTSSIKKISKYSGTKAPVKGIYISKFDENHTK